MTLDGAGTVHRNRVVIVYHVGLLGPGDSFEMNANNLRVFLTSLHQNKLSESTFVVMNISGGGHNRSTSVSENMINPLTDVIGDADLDSERSCAIRWSHTKSDLLTHALTVGALHKELSPSFGTYIFLNNGVRGPLARRKEWVTDFVEHLREVDMTGPVLSCQIMPHIPTPMFAFSSDLLELFLSVQLQSSESEPWQDIVMKREIGLSQTVLASGRLLGSLLHKFRWNEDHFDGSCRPELGDLNVSFYCEPFFNESIFIKYGGDFYRSGFFCAKVLNEVELVTRRILGP